MRRHSPWQGLGSGEVDRGAPVEGTGGIDAVTDYRVVGELAADGLEILFAALASQDRLALMEVLLREARVGGHGGLSISRLAAEAEISRFSASRHLSILRRAGLVAASYAGRRTLHHLNVVRLEAVEDWLYPFLLEGAREEEP
jgi:DNA-binding transcriptional ArsR family regulator